MRDAESILDQMISFTNGNLTEKEIRQSLGLIEQEIYFNFTNIMLEKDTAKILEFSNQIIASGHDITDFIHGLQEHFRNILITVATGDLKNLEVTDILKNKYLEISKRFAEKDIIHHLQLTIEAERTIKFSIFPELSLEMLLLKLTHKPSYIQLEELIAFINKIQKNHSRDYTNKISTENEENKIKHSKSKYDSRSKTRPSDNKTQKVTTNTMGISELENKLNGLKKLDNRSQNDNVSINKVINISLDNIKDKWDQIVEGIRSKKVALGSFLEEGIPYDVSGNQLIIAYDLDADFHKEHVAKNSKIIENLLENELGQIIRIGFKTIDFKKEGIEIITCHQNHKYEIMIPFCLRISLKSSSASPMMDCLFSYFVKCESSQTAILGGLFSIVLKFLFT